MKIRTYCIMCSVIVYKSITNEYLHRPLCNSCRTLQYFEKTKFNKPSRKPRTAPSFLSLRIKKSQEQRLAKIQRSTAWCLSASPQELSAKKEKKIEKKEKAENPVSLNVRTCKQKIILRKGLGT